MKTHFALLALLLTICRLLAVNNCEKASIVINTFKTYHVQPRAINDTLSQEIFDHTIEALDPRNQYFTLEDISKLSKYKNSIANDVQNKNCEFISDLALIYRMVLLRSDSIIDQVTAKPLDFKQKDTIVFAGNNEATYPENRKALERKWIKRFKYRTLTIQNPIFSTDSVQWKGYTGTEAELRSKLRTTYKNDIADILDAEGGLEEYVFETFLNTIAERFDPHSNYFSMHKYQQFMNSVSAQEENYGVVMKQEDNGEIVVERILPGSAAWRSNSIHKGDVLIQTQSPGKAPTDFSIADMEDVYYALYESDAKALEFTFRKANGNLETVLLQKEILKLDENRIKSYILDGERKIGYISLPDFYSDFESENKLGCANDVAREIIKMKQEGIEGLILDLRFNGGGSIKEVTELAGIFIDEGALFIEKPYGARPNTIKDPNRGTVYDGQMVVMVNKLSASAAEIFPAIMQDHQRAVVVGTSTFGKSTEQGMIPLSSAPMVLGAKQAEPKEGILKITLAKIYRLSGKTYQREGVTPDVHLPDAYEKVPTSEAKYSNALPNDTVDKKVYYKPLPPLPIQNLVTASNSRVKAISLFANLGAVGDSLSNMYHASYALELSADAYKKFASRYKKLYAQLDKNHNALGTQYFKAKGLAANTEAVDADSYRKELLEQQLKNIQQDIYIEEACHILNDLITFASH